MFFLRFLLIFHQKEFYSNRSSVSAGKKNSFQALSPFLCKRRIKWNERTKETLTHAYTHLTMQTPSRRWSKPFTDLFIWHTLSFIFQFNLKLIRRLGCCLFSAKKEEIILYIYIYLLLLVRLLRFACIDQSNAAARRMLVLSTFGCSFGLKKHEQSFTPTHKHKHTQIHSYAGLRLSVFVLAQIDICVCVYLYIYIISQVKREINSIRICHEFI